MVSHNADESTGGGHGDSHAGDHAHSLVTTHLTNHTAQQLAFGAKLYKALKYIALFTAFLTAFYTFRAFFMTFYGKEEVPHEAGTHAHESPPSMWVPLAILSAFALAIGAVLELSHAFAHFLSHTPSLATGEALATIQPGPMHMDIAVTSSIIAVVGIALAAFFYIGEAKEAAAIAKFMDLSLIHI